jgi:hypothetical protein
MNIVFLVDIARTHPAVLSLSELWAMVGRDMIDVAPCRVHSSGSASRPHNPGFTAMMRGDRAGVPVRPQAWSV